MQDKVNKAKLFNMLVNLGMTYSDVAKCLRTRKEDVIRLARSWGIPHSERNVGSRIDETGTKGVVPAA